VIHAVRLLLYQRRIARLRGERETGNGQREVQNGQGARSTDAAPP